VRVFLAGATGAIGRPLVDRLVAEGHEVIGTTRDESRARVLRERGAQAVVLDAFDTAAVHEAVIAAEPEVVVHQLTALPQQPDPRAMHDAVRLTARLRENVEAIRALEHAATGTAGIEGVVLRYGFYYGPGTWYDAAGPVGTMIRKRRFPMIGRGEGRASFVHLDDAVDATVRALDRGTPGIYNITDGTPAPWREWVPEAARLLGARPPRRVPAFVARRVAGPIVVHYATTLPGNASDRARAALDWRPRSWRDGFAEVFG
jgi:nucleoside-diphosphate-sugar epimerase